MSDSENAADVETGTTTEVEESDGGAISGTQSIESNAPPVLEEHLQGTEEEEKNVQTGGLLKSGVNASEAAKKRWARERERKANATEDAARERRGEVLLVRPRTVETGDIIDKLAREAKRGDVQAARELREWLKSVDIDRDTDVSALDRRTRQELKARLLADIQAARESEDDSVVGEPLGGSSSQAFTDAGIIASDKLGH